MALRSSPPARDMLEICLHCPCLASNHLRSLLLKQCFSFTCETRRDLEKGNQMQLDRKKFKEEHVGIPGCLGEGGPSMSSTASTVNPSSLSPGAAFEHT